MDFLAYFYYRFFIVAVSIYFRHDGKKDVKFYFVCIRTSRSTVISVSGYEKIPELSTPHPPRPGAGGLRLHTKFKFSTRVPGKFMGKFSPCFIRTVVLQITSRGNLGEK